MNETEKPGRGGRREGSGRPKGWRKPEGVRTQRQIRAYDDEWELIRKFCKLLKRDHRRACEEFLEQFTID